MKRHGLFIGVNQYEDPAIKDLTGAVNDASAIQKKLQYGQVLCNDAAIAKSIINEIENMRRTFEEGDFFIFYFSGHGCEINGEHLLICHDCKCSAIEEKMGAISLNKIKKETDVPGVKRLFVLDCCRSELFKNARGVENVFSPRSAAFFKDISSTEMSEDDIIPPLVLSSCCVGQCSFEDSKVHQGFFTEAFLKTIDLPEVKSFHAFRKTLNKQLKKLNPPGKQDVCWNGQDDIELPLFSPWGDQPTKEFTESMLLSAQVHDMIDKINQVASDGKLSSLRVSPEEILDMAIKIENAHVSSENKQTSQENRYGRIFSKVQNRIMSNYMQKDSETTYRDGAFVVSNGTLIGFLDAHQFGRNWESVCLFDKVEVCNSNISESGMQMLTLVNIMKRENDERKQRFKQVCSQKICRGIVTSEGQNNDFFVALGEDFYGHVTLENLYPMVFPKMEGNGDILNFDIVDSDEEHNCIELSIRFPWDTLKEEYTQGSCVQCRLIKTPVNGSESVCFSYAEFNQKFVYIFDFNKILAGHKENDIIDAYITSITDENILLTTVPFSREISQDKINNLIEKMFEYLSLNMESSDTEESYP